MHRELGSICFLQEADTSFRITDERSTCLVFQEKIIVNLELANKSPTRQCTDSVGKDMGEKAYDGHASLF